MANAGKQKYNFLSLHTSICLSTAAWTHAVQPHKRRRRGRGVGPEGGRAVQQPKLFLTSLYSWYSAVKKYSPFLIYSIFAHLSHLSVNLSKPHTLSKHKMQYNYDFTY